MHVKHCDYPFFFFSQQVLRKKCMAQKKLRNAMLSPPHLEHTTGGESGGPPLLPPSFSHHHQHLPKQAVRSLVGLQEEGSGCIHSLTMIKTHSEEPFKGPVPIMESLIGAYSARKVFAGGGKKVSGKQQSLCLLPCVCKIYAALHPSTILQLFLLSFLLKSVPSE